MFVGRSNTGGHIEQPRRWSSRSPAPLPPAAAVGHRRRGCYRPDGQQQPRRTANGPAGAGAEKVAEGRAAAAVVTGSGGEFVFRFAGRAAGRRERRRPFVRRVRRPEAEEGADHVHRPADIRVGAAVRAEEVPVVVRTVRDGQTAGRHRDTGTPSMFIN